MVVTFGAVGSIAMEAAILWLLIGAMTSILVVTGDTLDFVSEEISGPWRLGRAGLTALVVAVLILPLSLSQRYVALRYSNAIAVSCTVGVATILMTKGALITGGLSTLQTWPLIGSFAGILRAVPIIMFSVGCQVQVPSVYKDLEGRSLTHMRLTLTGVGITVCVIYTVWQSSG